MTGVTIGGQEKEELHEEQEEVHGVEEKKDWIRRSRRSGTLVDEG